MPRPTRTPKKKQFYSADNKNTITEADKIALLNAMKEHGCYDIDKLHESIPKVSKSQLAIYLKRMKDSGKYKAPDGKPIPKIVQWLQLAEEKFSADKTACGRKDTFTQVMNFIAYTEVHPPPELCDGIDFKKAYQYLGQLFSGAAPTLLDEPTAFFIKNATDWLSKIMYAPDLYEFREYLFNLTSIKIKREENEIFEESFPEELNDNFFNPFGIENCFLPADYETFLSMYYNNMEVKPKEVVKFTKKRKSSVKRRSIYEEKIDTLLRNTQITLNQEGMGWKGQVYANSMKRIAMQNNGMAVKDASPAAVRNYISGTVHKLYTAKEQICSSNSDSNVLAYCVPSSSRWNTSKTNFGPSTSTVDHIEPSTSGYSSLNLPSSIDNSTQKVTSSGQVIIKSYSRNKSVQHINGVPIGRHATHAHSISKPSTSFTVTHDKRINYDDRSSSPINIFAEPSTSFTVTGDQRTNHDGRSSAPSNLYSEPNTSFTITDDKKINYDRSSSSINIYCQPSTSFTVTNDQRTNYNSKSSSTMNSSAEPSTSYSNVTGEQEPHIVNDQRQFSTNNQSSVSFRDPPHKIHHCISLEEYAHKVGFKNSDRSRIKRNTQIRKCTFRQVGGKRCLIIPRKLLASGSTSNRNLQSTSGIVQHNTSGLKHLPNKETTSAKQPNTSKEAISGANTLKTAQNALFRETMYKRFGFEKIEIVTPQTNPNVDTSNKYTSTIIHESGKIIFKITSNIKQ